MKLALFDLDNTLLAGDSDFEWAQFLIEQGVLDREVYEARNQEFFEQYKAGTLDIHEFLDFPAEAARAPSARACSTRGTASSWSARSGRSCAMRRARSSSAIAATCAWSITATNSFVTAPIARELGIEHLIATEPEERDGEFTGGVTDIPCFREGKVQRARSVARGARTARSTSFERVAGSTAIP